MKLSVRNFHNLSRIDMQHKWMYYWPVSFQSLQTEIENHEPRIISLLETGEALINEGHPQSEEFRALIDDLMKRWQDLKDSIDRRNERLVLSDTAQQVSKAIVETSAPDKIKVEIELEHDRTYKMACVPSKDSNQPGHLPSLISLLCTQWVVQDPNFLHADSEDSDQTGRMPRLIWVFTGRTCPLFSFCHELERKNVHNTG